MSHSSAPSSNRRPDPGSTSSAWLAKLQQREPEAWHRLVHLYGPLVYAWCRQHGLQPPDAADVVQEVYRSVAVAVADFQRTPDGSFRGWLWTITRNKLNDYFRRLATQPPAPGGSDAQQRLLALPESDAAEPNEVSNTARLVQRALARIKPEVAEHTWQAFWRTAVDGLSPPEVAVELGLSADNVRQAKSRVLRRLRQELGDVLS
jgi:RNA polymerase sigma-70 factor (ECF subfamily)